MGTTEPEIIEILTDDSNDGFETGGAGGQARGADDSDDVIEIVSQSQSPPSRPSEEQQQPPPQQRPPAAPRSNGNGNGNGSKAAAARASNGSSNSSANGKGRKRPAPASGPRASSPGLPPSSWPSSQEDAILFPHSSALGLAAPVHRLDAKRRAPSSASASASSASASAAAKQRRRSSSPLEEGGEGEGEGVVAASISEILELGLPTVTLPPWATATAAEELRLGFEVLEARSRSEKRREPHIKKEGASGKGNAQGNGKGKAKAKAAPAKTQQVQEDEDDGRGGSAAGSGTEEEVIDGRPRLRSTAAKVVASGQRPPSPLSQYAEEMRRLRRVEEEQGAKRRRLDEEGFRAAIAPPLPTVTELLQQFQEREDGGAAASSASKPKPNAGRWKGGRGVRPPPELLRQSEAAAAAAAAAAEGGGAGVALSPETARIMRDRQRFAEDFEIELVEDRFDMEHGLDETEAESEEEEEEGEGAPAGPVARTCALCHREQTLPGLLELYPVKEHLQGPHAHLVDPRGEWMCTHPLLLGKTRPVWVHRLCALFCPRAMMESQRWRWFNVGREVMRGRSLPCSVCKMRGATMKCTHKACHTNVHLPCAVEAHGWLPAKMGVNVLPFLCRIHRAEAEAREVANLGLLGADISNGKEAQDVLFAPAPHEPSSSSSSSSAAEAAASAETMGPPPFTYLTTVVDGNDPSCRVRQGPRQLAVCCSCKGACVDVETCECLRQARDMGGHAYDWHERLLGRPPAVVLECNINCRCHMRDCSNRVAGRGVQRQLEVFALPGTKPVARGDGAARALGLEGEEGGAVEGYGVRVREAVSKGAFICEFTGQMAREEDVAAALALGDRRVVRILDWVLAAQRVGEEEPPEEEASEGFNHLSPSRGDGNEGWEEDWEDEDKEVAAATATGQQEEQEQVEEGQQPKQAQEDEEAPRWERVDGPPTPSSSDDEATVDEEGQATAKTAAGVAAPAEDEPPAPGRAEEKTNASYSSSLFDEEEGDGEEAGRPAAAAAAVIAPAPASQSQESSTVKAGLSLLAAELVQKGATLEYEDGELAARLGGLCIDARRVGNVARFIRRASDVPVPPAAAAETASSSSSSAAADAAMGAEEPAPAVKPNVRRVAVFSRTQDAQMPQLCLFAATNLAAGTELLL